MPYGATDRTSLASRIVSLASTPFGQFINLVCDEFSVLFLRARQIIRSLGSPEI